MKESIYRVKLQFNPKQHRVRPRVAKYLAMFQKDSNVSMTDFIRKHNDSRSTKDILYKSFAIARNLGILEKVDDVCPISLKDFSQQETIFHFLTQLRQSKNKNIRVKSIHGLSSTQSNYLYTIYAFNNWLTGKEFSFTQLVQTDVNMFRQQTDRVKLKGLEHFLKLYQTSLNAEPEYIRVIKQYLYDPIHKDKKAGTMHMVYTIIKSFFEKNESKIDFKFDPRTRYLDNDEDDKKLKMDELLQILTVGKPTLLQKAVVLCKFHRGLDNITLCDRFNFEAWKQIVEYFGTEQYNLWDLKKCPVPIILVRIKTDFKHRGFLENDAIVSIQKYLDWRYKKTGRIMRDGEPLFINTKHRPIIESWVNDTWKKLSTNAGLRKKIANLEYENDSHELRDLLKSSLIECGTRSDVADHVIGHMPKDSYEKQVTLYPDTVRREYAKGAHKINLFTNITNSLNNDNVKDERIRILEERTQMLERNAEKGLNYGDRTSISDENLKKLIDAQVEKSLIERNYRIKTSEQISDELVEDVDITKINTRIRKKSDYKK